VTKTSNAESAAFDANVQVGGPDARSDEERAAAERAQAEDTVDRLTTKRDKIARQLDDAEQALVDAEAELKGDD
jgi:hypothetical protein